MHSERERTTKGLERARADMYNMNKKTEILEAEHKKMQNKMKTDGAQMKTEIKKARPGLRSRTDIECPGARWRHARQAGQVRGRQGEAFPIIGWSELFTGLSILSTAKASVTVPP